MLATATITTKDEANVSMTVNVTIHAIRNFKCFGPPEGIENKSFSIVYFILLLYNKFSCFYIVLRPLQRTFKVL